MTNISLNLPGMKEYKKSRNWMWDPVPAGVFLFCFPDSLLGVFFSPIPRLKRKESEEPIADSQAMNDHWRKNNATGRR